MIFLGAGASKSFGIKTLQDLTNDLIDKMSDAGYGSIIDEIIESLKKFDITPDFESIYTILEGMTHLKEGVRKSGAFTAYVCKDIKHIKSHEEFHEILNDFKNLIYDECTIRSQNVEKVKLAYNELFKMLERFPRSEARQLTSSMGRAHNINARTESTIVTTNYDMSVDLYHRMIDRPLADGFRTTTDPFTKKMDVRVYDEIGAGRWLINLHGSIWQFKQGNRVIKTIADPKTHPTGIKIDEEMMIYPIGEKPMLSDPYYVFYDIFKQQRWQRLITIGYSFRDDPVNIAILENLKKIDDALLIVVNPDAESVIENLGSSAKFFNNRIIRIPEKFADKALFENLSIALQVTNWSGYKDLLGARNVY